MTSKHWEDSRASTRAERGDDFITPEGPEYKNISTEINPPLFQDLDKTLGTVPWTDSIKLELLVDVDEQDPNIGQKV